MSVKKNTILLFSTEQLNNQNALQSYLQKSRVQVLMPSTKTFCYKKLSAESRIMYCRGRMIKSVVMTRLNFMIKKDCVSSRRL